eukprot:scaffold803_cov213-Prasinococcus_capsulatus_cf.AAC.3
MKEAGAPGVVQLPLDGVRDRSVTGSCLRRWLPSVALRHTAWRLSHRRNGSIRRPWLSALQTGYSASQMPPRT